MARITDKERLDWIESWCRRNPFLKIEIWHEPELGSTLRKAIDAAIRAQRKAGRKDVG